MITFSSSSSKPKFGIQFRNFPSSLGDSIFDKMAEVALECENLRYDSLWMIDHVVLRPPIAVESQPVPDCFSAIAFLAEKTKRIAVGSLVSCILLRDQEFLARACLSINEISSGRLKIGLGSGWYEDDFRSYGISYPALSQRTELLAETSRYLRHFFQNCSKKPEIWIGGSGESKTLKVVAELGDACNLFGDPDEVAHKLRLLGRYLNSYRTNPNLRKLIFSKHSNVIIGRDDSEIRSKLRQIMPEESKWNLFVRNNIVGTPEVCSDQIREYLSAGVRYFTLNFPDIYDIEPLRQFNELVIRNFDQEIFA